MPRHKRKNQKAIAKRKHDRKRGEQKFVVLLTAKGIRLGRR